MKKFNVSTTDCQIVFLKSWKFRLPAVCGTYEHPASTQNSISTDKHTSFTIASFHVLLVTSEDKYSSCLVIKYGIIYNCMCSLPASLSIWMNSLCKKDKPRHIAENNLSILGFNLFSFYHIDVNEVQLSKSINLSWGTVFSEITLVFSKDLIYIFSIFFVCMFLSYFEQWETGNCFSLVFIQEVVEFIIRSI